MNKFVYAASTALLLLGSCSKTGNRNATVLRECAGVYLTINGKDYNVCNSDRLNGLATGDKVKVRYHNIEECTSPDYKAPMCFVGHHAEGWIEITEVRR